MILQTMLDQYALRRRENEAEENRRRRQIEAECAPVAALMHARHQMVLSSVRSIFSGTAESPVQKMEAYNQKIRAVLEENGYPGDYLSPLYQCPQCQDTGFVYRENRKEYCPCLLRACEAAARESDTQAGAVSFSAFDPLRFPETMLPGTDVTQREYMALVKEKCIQFSRQLAKGPVQCLLLHGGSGLGKTYLLHCIRREAENNGIPCQFVTAYDLLDALRQRYFGRESALAERCLSVPLLLIDDLGMEPLVENVTVEQIYHLLNSRLSQGLYTAVSTNLSRTELQKRYTERVTSRLLDVRSGMAIPFLGSDIRLQK